MTAPAVGPPRARVTRVLLADDSDGLRLLVRSWLSTVDDLEVVAEASNGAEAVALTDAHRPDVVVLDVAMPVMDGLEALTELRRRFPSLPVVMLSGFAERDVADQAARRGAFAFVEKSGDLDPLVEAVRRAASGPALPTPRRDETSTPRPAGRPPAVPPRRAAPPLPPWWATSSVPTVAAVLLFAAVAAWRLVESDPRAPVTFLYAVPILLVAVRHGLRWGLVTAALALAAYVAWAQSLDAGPPLVDNAVRVVVFVSVAVVAGVGFDRLRGAGDLAPGRR